MYLNLSFVCNRVRSCSHTHGFIHAHTHARARVGLHPLTHTRTQIHVHCTHTHASIRVYNYTHECASTLSHTHRHTHTHTHTSHVLIRQVHSNIFSVCSNTRDLFLHQQEAGCSTNDLNKFFISFNLLLCVVVTVASVLPKVQEGRNHLPFLRQRSHYFRQGKTEGCSSPLVFQVPFCFI